MFKDRAEHILLKLKQKYPNAKSYDLDGRGQHFVSEIDPVTDHLEFDRAIEVIFSSKPHKHIKMTQYYTIISGELELHLDDNVIHLKSGDKYTILPGIIHWAKSSKGAWVEIFSEPGWTAEDHIVVQ